MISQIISDYLSRQTRPMTQSIYHLKDMQDYNKIKKYYDYLDYSKDEFSKKKETPLGLINIGNTCYLNVILQLMFNIKYLREKICSAQNLHTNLLKKIRTTFGEMIVGKVPFVDPTQIFQDLKANNPDIFMIGVQNDFHQVYTLLLDSIKEGYKNTNAEQSRFIGKLLFGKLLNKINYHQGSTSKCSPFNVINLSVQQGSFEKALEKWRKYQIPDYKTPQGNNVVAIAENMLVQTPALMGFFINRVIYKDGNLIKDNRIFNFQNEIKISKAFQSDKTLQTKINNQNKQKQILSQIEILKKWVIKSQNNIVSLNQTIAYFKSKQIPEISQPVVKNPIAEQKILNIINYLFAQKQAISKKITQVKEQIIKLQRQIQKFQAEENYQRYLLWAVMIHQGNSANFGHYKICIHLGNDWFQFNDKLVSKISYDKISKYKQKGQICCLFYRRPTLICDLTRGPICNSLKTLIKAKQKQLKKQIDRARTIQTLHQQSQSINIMFEYISNSKKSSKYQYFFNPVIYAKQQKLSPSICKGIMLQQLLTSPSFKQSIQSKFLDEQSRLQFKKNDLKISIEYIKVSQVLKQFVRQQMNIIEIDSAYDYLVKANIAIKQSNFGKQLLNQIMQIFVLKGLYYLNNISQFSCNIAQKIVKNLRQALNILLNRMQDCQFKFVCISILASTKQIKINNQKKIIIKSKIYPLIDNYGQYFEDHFKYWIQQSRKISKLDQENYMHQCPQFKI